MRAVDAAVLVADASGSVSVGAEKMVDYCERHALPLIIFINGIDKGTAVRDVASLLGYSVADTIAIGDSDNDTAMLKAAGTSVAMGNAIHGIQAFCDFTTTDIHQDGLANAFKTLGLV